MYLFSDLRVYFASLLLAFSAASIPCQPPLAPEAIRLNNRGAAQMSQQFTERAAESFARALQADPQFAQASVNEGIALYALQKLPDAEAVLDVAIRLAPTSAQAWYNLGLVEHAANHPDRALVSFTRAAQADPTDADSLYYEGVCQQELHHPDQAITSFRAALALSPLHASAEFALARALQRSGQTAEAHRHFARFQHLTGSKISSALGLSYGEQGRYSTVAAVPEPTAKPRAMPEFQLRALALAPAPTATGGACMIDATGTGRMDLVLLQSGMHAVAIFHPLDGGGFAPLHAEALGLAVAGNARACAVGDYDGDGRNDLAIALDDRLLLFRNLGNGHFADVTASARFAARNRPTGITWVDYDHDGDLDLLLTGSPLTAGGASNVLWRNNGNGTFTEQTTETGLEGEGPTQAALLTDFNNDRAVDRA